MNRLPYELLRCIGSHLKAADQMTCSLVCKLWRVSFQYLLFQDVRFYTDEQLQLYMKQSPSLKKLTTSFEFNVSVSEEIIEELAQTCPFFNALTTEVHEQRLPLPKIDSHLQLKWYSNLVKLDGNLHLMKALIPLISHQLSFVGGIFSGLVDGNKTLIPMPQLKILQIESDEEGEERIETMSAKGLDEMRVSYPKLQELAIIGFSIKPVMDDTFIYTPFPFVRSFSCSYCSHVSEKGRIHQLKNMFTDLRVFKLDYCYRYDSPEARQIPNPYYDFFNGNLNIYKLQVDYLPFMSQKDGFPALRLLLNLTWLRLGFGMSPEIILERELLDLDLLLSSAPKLKSLSMDGYFYVSTGESFDNYLCGTVGFCDTSPQVTYNRRPGNSMVGPPVVFQNERDDDHKDTCPFGNGEKLYKTGTLIITVKKKKPLPVQSEPFQIYAWNEANSKDFRMFNHDLPKSIVTSHSLRKLKLNRLTLKNPTYKWITLHLPLLEKFTVDHTEPYPYCNIVLGEKIKKFSISLDMRYKKFGKPIVHLKINDSQEERTTLAWISSFKIIRQAEADKISESAYAITFTCNSIPTHFNVCDSSISEILSNVDKAEKLK